LALGQVVPLRLYADTLAIDIQLHLWAGRLRSRNSSNGLNLLLEPRCVGRQVLNIWCGDRAGPFGLENSTLVRWSHALQAKLVVGFLLK